ncbi:MAG: hypothetical protein V7K69_08865 [Nostoc sp.]|uniref:hypothetical protein n=1 Tax=Nostoc sp. TaxID=1180 RepID=UPI002FFB1C69
MTQPNFLELAKQGDAQAIASLLNRQLQPKGITAKIALKDGCLQVMLESAQVPNQQALVAFIRKDITSLGAASIERAKIYGRQIGEEFPAWSDEFEVELQKKLNSFPIKQSLDSDFYQTRAQENNSKIKESVFDQKFTVALNNFIKRLTIKQCILSIAVFISIIILGQIQEDQNKARRQVCLLTSQATENCE